MLPTEFSLSGVYLPGGVLLLLLLLPVFAVTDRLLLRSGAYAWLWHPSLFRMAMFLCIYCISYVLLLG
ncbi:MAG: DUF1656 domain-containing protein [Pseudomonadota bacterium]|nr:DUF1656 domain-containing protein [Pseudomonadota bacterium]